VCDQGSVEDARARARAAKAREIEAHRRAIKMHEDAVILFDRFHQTSKSLRARERVEHARELLRQALAEQEEAGGQI
jgi:putative ubiquitin-RnfH superfamily antitoxin RatB of RatAB toxin-antitoxin module